jgi:hypothetical protein
MRDSFGSRTFFFSCPITFTRCFRFHLPEIPSSKPSRCGNAGQRDKRELSGSVISLNTDFVQTKAGAIRRITFWRIRYARDWLWRFPSGRMYFCPTPSKPLPRTARRGVPTVAAFLATPVVDGSAALAAYIVEAAFEHLQKYSLTKFGCCISLLV